MTGEGSTGDGASLGGWALAIAGGGFWVGILVAGAPDRGPGVVGGTALLVGGAAGLAALAWRQRDRPGRHGLSLGRIGFLVVISFGLLGTGWFGVREAHVAGSPLARLAGRSVELWGSLAGDPAPGTLGWTVPVQVDEVFPSTPGWPAAVRVHDPVWAEGRGSPPHLRAGDRVALTGLLERAGGSFGAYLRHRGFAATFSTSQVRLRGPPTNPLLRAADAVRAALRSSLQRVFPAREAG